MPSAAYPLDTTGMSPGNLITDEAHVLTEVNARTYRLIVPTFSPFYLDNFAFKHKDLLGNITPLIRDIHYFLCMPYVAATRSIGKNLYGAIALNQDNLQGEILVSYQTLGGDWIADPTYVLEQIVSRNVNPRISFWDNLTNVQDLFPPINHQHDADDINGMQDLLDSLKGIEDAVLAGPQPSNAFVSHIIRSDNPHGTTSEQVGLGDVANLPVATDQEVIDRQAVDKYILLRQAIGLLAQQQYVPLLTARQMFFSRMR